MRTACPFHTAEVHDLSDEDVILAEARQRVNPLDLVVLGLVPAVLVALHTLPEATRVGFGFHLRRPTVVTAYTASFFHFDWPHLQGNLVAYLLIVPLSYLLSVLSNRRRHFLVTFGIVLTACPFVVAGSHLPFPSDTVTMGFSGLAMALYGYASLIFVGYLSTRLTTGLHLDYAPLIFFSQIAAIAVVTAPLTTGVLGIVGVSLGIVGLYALWFLRSGHAGAGVTSPGWGNSLAVAVVTAVVISFFLVVGFTGSVNHFAHFVGYASGFVLSYVVLRVDCSLSHVRHCAGPGSDCTVHNSWGTRLLRRLLVRVDIRE